MSDQKQSKPKAIYKPGELEKTRQNIGMVSKEEAMKIAQRLGGEVGVEKSVDTSDALNKRKRTFAHKKDSVQTNTKQAASVAPPNPIIQQKTKARTSLPYMHSKEKSLIDKLMASPEYHIKPNYGFLSFILNLRKGGTERVLPDFILNTLHNHLGHLQKFTSSMKRLTGYAPDSYKKQIQQNDDPFFRAIKFMSEWDLTELGNHYTELERKSDECTVTMLIPFTRTLYRSLLTIYFLGDSRIFNYIKKAYADIIPYVTSSLEPLFQCAKEAASEWLYISGQIVKGMYPLLLRMSCTQFEEYSSFFSTRISKILTFLDVTKYDLILPSKEQDEQKNTIVDFSSPQDEPANNKTESVEIAEQEPSEPETNTENTAKKDNPSELTKQGLALLDTLFPEAGWNVIQTMPDMYPYFQTLYAFTDGFNLLAPENPMQITLVLLRILEDLFVACRNIKFSIDKEPDFTALNDNLADIFSEWSLYREQVGERMYLGELKDYVNHIYTQSDFGISPYAKKKLSNLLWQTKYLFLPHLSFELIFMERPDKDATYKPMPKRVEYLKAVFSLLVSRIEQSGNSSTQNDSKANEDIYGAANLFSPYRFDVPNVVSRRIDVLLGGKKSKNAHNYNLLKYTLCIIAVLDWWINSSTSPGYAETSKTPYRVSKEDGSPIFSVPTRNDQNSLFLQKIKEKTTAKAKNTES